MSALVLLLLGLTAPLCERHTVTVTADDAKGRQVQYRAPYWLCAAGAQPVAKPVVMVCFENGNPYGRELWAHPAHRPDVAWLCTPTEK